ncbi:right-handed parallel beta-helix repeat-containing protein [Cohnella sp. JJ-181]|uniref:right-handed parallel beta-helix repeat-containing protein n=1 Tax=Cohnella rhizoplanae TaxID=2974897 RepID=UPI0022FF9A18|nr:right-handed parallel beta-helix repeat-containing protein [Cohnella sp. JJ-181]CAI6025165.1 hypothetical protein COHCIP112018_00475 [Cohnella sp. JJ-181]
MLIKSYIGNKPAYRKWLIALLCMAMVLAMFSAAQPQAHAATDIWVAPPTSGGNDSSPGDGTSAHPYATIGKAYSVAGSGDTIKVRAGTYAVGTSLAGFKTTKDNIKYVSVDGKYQASIVPADATKSFDIWENWGSHVEIDGFEIDGSGTQARNGILNQGSYVTIKNNDVHDIMGSGTACDSNGGAGINVTDFNFSSFMTGTVVTANKVHNIGHGTCGYIQSIYISTKATVTNNVVYDNPGGAGIHLWHDAHEVDIVNNTIDNHNFGIVVGAGNTYKACTLDSWGCTADHVYVANNIITDSTYGIDLSGTVGSNNTYDYNLINDATYDWYPTTMTHGTHNITGIGSDPAFVNYAGDDFRLSSASPAVNAGSSANAPSVDFAGNARTGTPDIGAYEYGSTGGGSGKTLTFWEKDSEAGTTSTYWYKQALVDGAVVWESDVTADGTGWQSHSVPINPSGSTFTLQFRLISKKAVSNYPISFNVDDVAVSGTTVANADFETTTGWSYSETTVGTPPAGTPFTGAYDAAFHGGAQSYKISYPGSTASAANFSAQISQSLTAGKTLTFWEKDSIGSDTPNYWYKQALVDGVVVWESDVTADGTSWQQRSVPINPTGSSFTLQFRLISKQAVSNYPISFYVDDAAVSGTTVANANFESATGWSYGETTIGSPPAGTPFTGAFDASFHGGAQSYKISYPGSTASSVGYNASISQSVPN